MRRGMMQASKKNGTLASWKEKIVSFASILLNNSAIFLQIAI
jgi:hypothetical protein